MNKFLHTGIGAMLSATMLIQAQEPQEIPLNQAVPDAPAPVFETIPQQNPGASPQPSPGGPQGRPTTPIAPPVRIMVIRGINGLNMGKNIPSDVQQKLQELLADVNNDAVFFRTGITREDTLETLLSFQKLDNNTIERRILEIEALAAANTRQTTDPFGLGIDGFKAKDPDEGITAEELARLANLPSLQNAIGTLKILAVMPQRKEFLSEGGQNIFEGDRIRLIYQGQEFMARVERVEATRIVFRDRVSGDRATLPLNLGPPNHMNKTGGRTDGFLSAMPPVDPVNENDQ